MKIKHFITLALIAFTFFNCEKDNVLAPETEVPALETLPDLSKGITPYLTAEEKAFFQASELKELNQLVKFPEAQLDFRSGNVVEVPADSEDALAEAILEAGEGGTVILKAGMHTESSSVVIPFSNLTLRGEEGAVLKVQTQVLSQIGFADPAIYIFEAHNARVIGIDLQANEPYGGTGILIQDSEKVLVSQNSISGFQFGVAINYADYARVMFNDIVTPIEWSTGTLASAIGIAVGNGTNARIIGNSCSNALFGIFASDDRGFLLGNTLNQNLYGLILCKLVGGGATTPNNVSIDALVSAQNWMTIYNTAEENGSVGYLVIDGANHNYLNNNFAENNGAYDIELAGASDRFGFPMPPCANNRVFVRAGQTVKNCGDNNFVRGGIAIDTSEDTCM